MLRRMQGKVLHDPGAYLLRALAWRRIFRDILLRHALSVVLIGIGNARENGDWPHYLVRLSTIRLFQGKQDRMSCALSPIPCSSRYLINTRHGGMLLRYGSLHFPVYIPPPGPV